jgi:DNA uptake protein ComE-like DNA-binding protein
MKENNPLYISKRSKNGVLIFILIALIVVFIPRFIQAISQKEKFKIASEDIKFLKENQSKRKFNQDYHRKKYTKKKFGIPPQKFDPNTYSEREWMNLGLSQKQAAIVFKFTKRGIYSNEQLQKIFVIPTQLYELIKDSTFYSKKSFDKENLQNSQNDKKTKIFVDINSADQEKLETIPGVGSFYAKNIIKYRDRLGGFVKKEQLLEVWKMDVEKYNSIEEFILINEKETHKIDLNSATAEEFKQHPYFNWNIANSIVKMRNQKGLFKRIEEIKESVLIDEEFFEKIKPYLSL